MYIGQTQNTDTRKSDHFRRMISGTHSNYKVQKAYKLYGLPEFIVLEQCSVSELNNYELFWQNEFNSLASLDIIVAGTVGFGANSNASKYSKYLLLKVFSCLYQNKLKTFKKIAVRCGLSDTSLIRDIYRGSSHLWLKYEYPRQYALMRTINYRSQSSWGSIHRTYKNIISPDGCLFYITESVLNSSIDIKERYYPQESIEVIRKGISRVLSGTIKSWRGWKLSAI